MIEFKQILIKNFRRYADASFDFEHFNIILARNGVGKSTLFDAFTWCFFEEEDHLKIDPKYAHECPTILNLNIQKNLKVGDRTEVKVNVFIKDTNTKKDYNIERSKKFVKEKDGKIFGSDETTLVVYEKMEKDRDWTRVINVSPSVIIEKIIPKNLRQFFFFDGEKLREHFEKNTNRYLEEKIKEVSRANLLDEIEEELGSYHQEIFAKKKRLVTDERLSLLMDEVMGYEKELKAIENRYATLNKSIKELKELKEKLRLDMDTIGYGVKAIEKMNADYLTYECLKNETSDNLKNIKDEYHEYLLSIAPYVFTYKKMRTSLECINKAVDENKAPPPITEDYLERILVSNLCICKRTLGGAQNKKYREEIKKLKVLVGGTRSVNYGKGQVLLDQWIKSVCQFNAKIDGYRTDIKKQEDNLQNYDERLNGLKNARSGTSMSEMTRKQKELEIVEEEIGTKQEEKGQLELERNDLKMLFDEKHKEYVEKQNKIDKKGTITAKEQKCSELIEEMKKFRIFVIEKNRKKLMRLTEEYLKQLLTAKRSEISDVEISEDYELRIGSVDNPHINLRHSLSAGETQIFIFAFAAALRKVTGFSAPLIVDTPLGKLDQENRLGVIDSLPALFGGTQIIFLVTNSEYQDSEKNRIKEKIGKIKEFNIGKSKDKSTNVIQVK